MKELDDSFWLALGNVPRRLSSLYKTQRLQQPKMNSTISYMRNRPYREAQLPTKFEQKAFGQLKTVLL